MARRKIRRAGVTTPTASMADIAFQLIIFFILASDFARTSNVKLTLPQNQDIEQKKKLPPVIVSLDKEGKIWIESEPAQLEGLEAAVNAKLAAAFGGNTADYEVMLQADKEQEYAQFEKVLKALAAAGARIAMAGEKEK